MTVEIEGESIEIPHFAPRALKNLLLVDEPESLYLPVEENMRTAFSGQAAPGTDLPIEARIYLEHRSRVGPYINTVQWMWIIAGIHSCLARGKTEEARARAALALVAGEQFSMDGGSWMMAQELLFEDPPPLSSFEKRPTQARGSEVPHTHLADPRWIEVALARLKDVDEMTERQRRLKGGARGGPSIETEEEKAEKKKKAEAKAKARRDAVDKKKKGGGAGGTAPG